MKKEDEILLRKAAAFGAGFVLGFLSDLVSHVLTEAAKQKNKDQLQKTEDAEFEIIQPKQIEYGNDKTSC